MSASIPIFPFEARLEQRDGWWWAEVFENGDIRYATGPFSSEDEARWAAMSYVLQESHSMSRGQCDLADPRYWENVISYLNRLAVQPSDRNDVPDPEPLI